MLPSPIRLPRSSRISTISLHYRSTLAATSFALLVIQASCAGNHAPQGAATPTRGPVAPTGLFTSTTGTPLLHQPTQSSTASTLPYSAPRSWSGQAINEENATSLAPVLSIVEERITAIEWSPDGNELAVGKELGDKYVIELLRIPSLDALSLEALTTVPDIVFSLDGNFVFATLGRHGPLVEWDSRTGELTRTFLDPEDRCPGADFLALGEDARHVIAGYVYFTDPSSSAISAWDLGTGTCAGEKYSAYGDLTELDVSREKAALLLGFDAAGTGQPNHVDILDGNSFATICSIPDASRGLFIPAADAFAALSSALDVYTLPNCSASGDWFAVAATGTFAFSPDGTLLASTALGTAEIRSRGGRKILAQFEVPDASQTWIRFSPDGRWVAIATDHPGTRHASLAIYGIPLE